MLPSSPMSRFRRSGEKSIVTASPGADLSSPEALRGAVDDIARACAACHDTYREMP